ncbi:MAG TPA: hypothetical protein VF135_08140 [Terriglobales bacterium]
MTKGTVGKGWKLVWRHSRILWWVFAVNLVLGLLATITTRLELGNVLNKSLHSAGIANRFDMGVFIELIAKPEISLGPLMGGTLVFPWLFFLFMLFVIGGILTAYREDRRLTTSEFFEASGGYFWRMVRLFLLSIIPLALCGVIFSIFFGIASQLENERSAFRLQIVGGIIGIVCVLLFRLWFDVAQVRAVAQNEHGMFRNLLRAFSISFRALGTLLWMYLRISVVAWLFLWLGLWLWTHLPGNQVAFTWLLLEIVMLTQIFARLWQRAASVTWYGLYAEEHPAAVVEFTTPHPAELTAPPAAPDPVPPAEPI